MGSLKHLPASASKNFRFCTMPGHTNVERSLVMAEFRRLAREVRCGVELVQGAFESLRRFVEIEGLKAKWFNDELRVEGFTVGRHPVGSKRFLVSAKNGGVGIRIVGSLNITNNKRATNKQNWRRVC